MRSRMVRGFGFSASSLPSTFCIAARSFCFCSMRFILAFRPLAGCPAPAAARADSTTVPDDRERTYYAAKRVGRAKALGQRLCEIYWVIN